MSIRACCGNCRWWEPQAPSLATATERYSVSPGVGACHARAPVVFNQGPGLSPQEVTLFPETHQDRFCGDWDAPVEDDDPDDGEEVATGDVVPFMRSAAA